MIGFREAYERNLEREIQEREFRRKRAEKYLTETGVDWDKLKELKDKEFHSGKRTYKDIFDTTLELAYEREILVDPIENSFFLIDGVIKICLLNSSGRDFNFKEKEEALRCGKIMYSDVYYPVSVCKLEKSVNR